VILKFWLNVSKQEQKLRFVRRLENPEKNWKFSSSDIKEREYWDKYMNCYESMLNQTSRTHAPWYAIPADNKPYMRLQVANTVIKTLESLDMHYPEPEPKNAARFDEFRRMLKSE
jgi:polyphosphate kinase 2 (PPK2 family)